MAFRDLDEFLVVEPFVLPIRGKEYVFPGEISGRLWLRLQRISEQIQQAKQAEASGGEFSPDAEAVSDEDEAMMREELFGDVAEEMAEDGLSSGHMKAAFYALIAFHLSGRDAAEAVWNAQGESPAPNRAARPASRRRPPGHGAPTLHRTPRGAARRRRLMDAHPRAVGADRGRHAGALQHRPE